MKYLMSLMCVLFTSSICLSAEYYIAPDGKDSNPGTKELPFSTLEKARNTIRELKEQKSFPQNGITIWLREGVYYRTSTFELNENDSGQKDARVIYKAFENEDVRIMGGCLIDPSKATKVTNPEVLNRILSAETRKKVYQIDLKQVGITNYGKMSPRGFRRPYVNPPLELFINDQAMYLARWPNDSDVQIGKVIDPGSNPRENDFSNRGGKFLYDYDRPEHWKQADDIWITGLFCYGYADDTVKISNIDTEKKIITTVHPHMYTYQSGKIWQAYHFLNLLEEIDVPGEYYLDRKNGVLYFYPTSPMEKAKIAVSLLDEPLVAMEGASFVTFEKITFEVTRGIGFYIERGTGNLIAGCTLRNMGTVAVCIGMGIEPFDVYRHDGTGKPVSRQLGSWHEHLYANTTFNRKAGTDHGVVGCNIYNTGAGGISLGGGDRKTLTPAGNYVKNCDIHHFNRLDRSYKAGVNIDGVGNRIEHCNIGYCPNNAIYLKGNDHLIEYNEIHHAVQHADDMGAFYMDRDPSEQGNVLRYNFWHHNGKDIGGAAPASTLYMDDFACGLTVFGNIFYKTSPLANNGGFDHQFLNNIFVDASANIPDGMHFGSWEKRLSEPPMKKRLQEDLDVTKPPYSIRYPNLSDAYTNPAAVERGCRVWYNVSVRSGEFGRGRNNVKNNFITDKDPGFVDAANMNFQLREDSIVYKKIPEFKNIPFEKIGLYKDEYRTKLLQN